MCAHADTSSDIVVTYDGVMLIIKLMLLLCSICGAYTGNKDVLVTMHIAV